MDGILRIKNPRGKDGSGDYVLRTVYDGHLKGLGLSKSYRPYNWPQVLSPNMKLHRSPELQAHYWLNPWHD
ncbi:unnamed protein product [Dovyalis caffra]|uniref:Uncharacterized protein n=1 Tax=Dovyalis caffra TaxID=77055 RepID=A0AAV1SF36_9ROSI|nr:unnamed protein product [Dovyalis caffra]